MKKLVSLMLALCIALACIPAFAEDIINLKYVASQLLNMLVGSFGLVTAAPLTALVSVASRKMRFHAGIAARTGK